MRAHWFPLALLLAACAAVVPPTPLQTPDLSALLESVPQPAASPEHVRQVVEQRCVVCHGCYDAPCQLKLSSPDGLARGASKADVYDTSRLADAPPTRLGIDAQTEEEWRGLGFHSVAMPADGSGPDGSLMARLLALGRSSPIEGNAPLPADVSLDRDRALTCPTPGEFDAYAAANPLGGMPYGMAPLTDDEFAALGAWVLSGEPLPSRPFEIPRAIARRIADWEAFLNADDPRMRLVARYIYEHLFLAHLHFEGDAPDRFHRLVRSSTPPGEPVREIATRRPFDDPGPALSYRITPIDETILHKDHLVYPMSPARIARLRALFLAPAWEAGPPPPYGERAGGNPFVTFASIPAEARYRFLLDDALHFVRSFIRGPVCRGQVATDVIEDRFWVAFQAPEADLSVTDPSFLRDGGKLLKLPVTAAEAIAFKRLWPALHDREGEWLAFRDARYAANPRHAGGLGMEGIWDGDGRNEEALLTVFRNADNASVTTGFIGAIPETAWVIDYPIFERIHYDLVAGYDVFGDVETQLTTRLYMDHLRREAEDLFLAYLPRPERRRLHDDWYRGPLADLHASWTERRMRDDRPTGVAFSTDDPKAELLAALPARSPGLWATQDPFGRCGEAACTGRSPAERPLAEISARTGAWVRYMPDVSLLRVTRADGTAEVFTLFHDKAHTNVGLLLAETGRREPERDALTVMPGQLGSYPNLFFEVEEASLGAFAEDLMAMRSQDDWLEVVRRHGVRRTSGEFWRVSDAMADDMMRQDPVEGGVLDLNRYIDPRPGDVPN